jgi:hypothetical protein
VSNTVSPKRIIARYDRNGYLKESEFKILRDYIAYLETEVKERKTGQMMKMPKLNVEAEGAGIRITALMQKKYNCAEFTLRDDVPQAIFESVWIQFMPADMRADLLALANEIIRRANAYEALERKIDRDREILRNWQEANAEDRRKSHFYACALSEITSKIKDPILQAEAAEYIRKEHRHQLVHSLKNCKLNSLEYNKARSEIEEIIQKTDYTQPPHPDSRKETLGIRT